MMDRLTRNELIDEMNTRFGLPPAAWIDPLMWSIGAIGIDPIRLETALERKHGEKVEGGTSLSDFILQHYGKETRDFVANNL